MPRLQNVVMANNIELEGKRDRGIFKFCMTFATFHLPNVSFLIKELALSEYALFLINLSSQLPSPDACSSNSDKLVTTGDLLPLTINFQPFPDPADGSANFFQDS